MSRQIYCPQCPTMQLTAEHVAWHVAEHKCLNLTYDQIALMPPRTTYLDKTIMEATRATMAAGKPLLFMPTGFLEKLWAKSAEQSILSFTGVLPCGSKAVVELTDVPVYIDVDAQYADIVHKMCMVTLSKKGDMPDVVMKTVPLFRIHNFQTEKVPFTRFHFASISDRKQVLAAIKDYNSNKRAPDCIVTAADDTGAEGHFMKIIARNNKFMTCGWNLIRDYRVLKAVNMNAEYKIEVSLGGFKKLRKVERAEIVRTTPLMARVLDKDPTMSTSWDIETNTKSPHKAVPRKGDPDYTIFMICSMYSWFHSTQPLLNVCCVDSPTAATHDLIVIECASEREVLLAHFEVGQKMHYELSIAFNGSNFDWPLVIDKAERYGITGCIRDALSIFPMPNQRKTGREILKYNQCQEKMKIDAENVHVMDAVVKFPTMLDIDVRPIFMKLYTKAEGNNSSSLNFYLRENQLAGKEDMPYKTMFKIHDRAHMLRKAPTACHCHDVSQCVCCQSVEKLIDCVKIGDGDTHLDYSDELLPELKGLCCACGKRPKNRADMGLVAYYCAIDCLRPQQLMVKRAIIMERRGLACSSYVSLYDGVYRADGQKVKNLIACLCNKMDIAFSNAPSGRSKSEKEHFPGGYVFPPVRGLNNKWPTTGLDFASLYPSLMMAYNHSPDMIVLCKKYADKLIALGYTLHPIGPIHYTIGEKKDDPSNTKCVGSAWSVRHNGIHGQQDTHIITRYERQVTVTCNGNKKTYVGLPAHDEPASPLPFDYLADMIKCGVDTTGFDHTTEGEVNLVAIRDGRKALPGERMGIFPMIVKKLFDKRVPIKRLWSSLEHQLAQMEKDGQTTGWREVDGENKELTLEQLQMMFVMVEVKQKAIKVLANTFYGVSGDYLNDLYSLFVASGITESGQANIKRVRDFVIAKGFTVKYGDTDSLYIVAPERVYADATARYQRALASLQDAPPALMDTTVITTTQQQKDPALLAKEAYWQEIVLITMHTIRNLTVQVSEFLMWNNGTRFLNMAFEEVGFPTMLCGKKKYFLLPHLDPKTINLYTTKLMVRGIESVKQGQTKMAKRASNLFMQTVMSPTFMEDPVELAKRIIVDDCQSKLDYRDFVLSGKYKNKDVKNVPVLRFVERMTILSEKYRAAGDHKMAEFYLPPEPGDKFEYIVVRRDTEYDLRGCKVKFGKGDHMEYVRTFLASQDTGCPLEIDLNHYIEKAYLKLFVRFIAYDDQFAHPTVVATDDSTYKIVDDYSSKQAEKYLVNYVRSLLGFDKDKAKAEGLRRRAAFRAIDKQIESPELALIAHKFGDQLPDVDTIMNNALNEQIARVTSGAVPATMIRLWVARGVNLFDQMAHYKPGSIAVRCQMQALEKLRDDTRKKLVTACMVYCGVIKRRDERLREILNGPVYKGISAPSVALSRDEVEYVTYISDTEKAFVASYGNLLRLMRAYEQISRDRCEIYGLLLQHKRSPVTNRVCAVPLSPREMAEQDCTGYVGSSGSDVVR